MRTKIENKDDLTQEELKRLLDYDPLTGIFTWIGLSSKRSHVKIGDLAGGISKDGYRKIRVLNKLFLAHRLAWMFMEGAWPEKFIDHKNGIRHDNRWENLRNASRNLNCENRQKTSNNTARLIGAHWDKNNRTSPWCSQIKVNGKYIYLGRFKTPEEAHQAYLEAKRKYHEGCTI